ncbi:hypothetical protein D5400_17605 [Georhizobium profundi]|uniref:Uncharacterized protein n=1 Tax=Georhizobium profundi TaxID=2341112 RepID=A0A3S9B7C7_9HYPH|nr:hypothetical protein D5400_17605 [Georhizobium profundi]
MQPDITKWVGSFRQRGPELRYGAADKARPSDDQEALAKFFVNGCATVARQAVVTTGSDFTIALTPSIR